ncbi:hypothetical protein EYR36_008576 [Pleurotus pulmonarius]|nr:hypothetical protein EYR36_008576 [Pleurotus pulmonarius]
MVPYLMTLREASEAAGSPEHALVNAYNAVQITGLVLLVAIVLTARLSSTINRSIAWYNLILSFIFYAVSFLLIMGKQFGPEPPFALCLVQCLFVYAAPVISLITNIVVTVFMALLLPVFGELYSETAQLDILTEKTFVGVTIYRVSRKWKASRHLRFDTDDRAPVQMIVRFGMVCLLPVPAVILSVLSVPAFDGRGDGPLAVAIATYPIWAALIFGIQSVCNLSDK